MITCYLRDGKFERQSYQDFEEIARSVDTCREALAAMPLDAVIKILDVLGKNVSKTRRSTRSRESVISHCGCAARTLTGSVRSITPINGTSMAFVKMRQIS